MRHLSQFATFAAAISIVAAPATAQSMAAGSMPVQLEAVDGLDPCSFGQINDPAADSAVMVFAGPSTDLDAVDYLNHADKVWMCQEVDGFWGVVYPAPQTDMDCEIAGGELVGTVNYSGPCNTGWIKAEWVELLAG